ncbi:MAG: hypothetical protein HDS02_03120 [Bacteroides sp.]|nr:hypothetical protein [Bacteroides sp.]
MEQDLNQPTPEATSLQPEVTPASTHTDSTPTEPTAPASSTDNPPASSPQRLSEADALTASRLMELLSQAEERGYRRARREMQQSSLPETHLWGNPRRVENEGASARETMKIGDDFLTRIRPAVWD